ncbi:hypothetical protein XBO1_1300102 [Xenorhabdus bovienii str. oregonense]|uniref:Uncharacterized protein n=1 Tax=Xenorhabdus bovienii str. oregonense TaxID=1398202 RepID=A0A077P1C8_XENBV|nr:hypothetical protein XBO1_1300102 [Xenorhabdus bovienii str. oregonense]
MKIRPIFYSEVKAAYFAVKREDTLQEFKGRQERSAERE